MPSLRFDECVIGQTIWLGTMEDQLPAYFQLQFIHSFRIRDDFGCRTAHPVGLIAAPQLWELPVYL